MTELTKTNLHSKLFKKNWSNPALEVPGKATSEEMLVDCLTVKEQNFISSLTSSEATNYSTPRALWVGWVWKI